MIYTQKVVVILLLHLVTKEEFNSFSSDKHMKITGRNEWKLC